MMSHVTHTSQHAPRQSCYICLTSTARRQQITTGDRLVQKYNFIFVAAIVKFAGGRLSRNGRRGLLARARPAAAGVCLHSHGCETVQPRSQSVLLPDPCRRRRRLAWFGVVSGQWSRYRYIHGRSSDHCQPSNTQSARSRRSYSSRHSRVVIHGGETRVVIRGETQVVVHGMTRLAATRAQWRFIDAPQRLCVRVYALQWRATTPTRPSLGTSVTYHNAYASESMRFSDMPQCLRVRVYTLQWRTTMPTRPSLGASVTCHNAYASESMRFSDVPQCLRVRVYTLQWRTTMPTRPSLGASVTRHNAYTSEFRRFSDAPQRLHVRV